MLLIAAGNNQTGFLQVHRPEFCYTAAGYQLGERQPQPVPIGGGRQIVANKLSRHARRAVRMDVVLDAGRDAQIPGKLGPAAPGDRPGQSSIRSSPMQCWSGPRRSCPTGEEAERDAFANSSRRWSPRSRRRCARVRRLTI